jgi:hypothetical protein
VGTKRRFAAVVSIGALLMVTVPLLVTAASADPNPLLARGNGLPRLSNGKGVAHFSGAVEATYDERAQRSDLNAAASDAPPDVTVSALGCANRGSVTNPRVNQDCTLRRQAEEQVVVNPLDANNVIAGQNDSRVGFNHCGFDYSLDGGRTWGDGQPPFFQHLSPVGHTYDAASDPALTFDGTGRAWYSCVLFDLNDAASAVAVAPSTPGLKGSAYSNIGAGPSPFIAAEAGDPSHGYDKEFIAADRRAGHTEVYVTFTDFQSNPNCVRSNNKGGLCQSAIYLSKWTGSKWTAPLEISGSSPLCTQGDAFNKKFGPNACNFDQGSFPVVLSDGSVYVVFNNFNTPTLVNQQLGVRVSADLSTVSAPVKVGVDDETKWALCDFGRGPEGCVDSLNIRTQDFPALAADPSDPSHLVATWQDTRVSNGSGNYDIVVSESHDGGATWSDRNGHGTVLTTSGAYFQPSVSISAPGGHVVVSTYHANTALHTAQVGDGTYGYGYLVDSGSGFGAYTPASDGQAYPSPQANATQSGFLGDYSSTSAAPSGNVVYMVWADTRNSNSAGPDEDVFIFKVAV